MSLPVESKKSNISRCVNNQSDDENTNNNIIQPVMTIQERLAALKKNNSSMDWKAKQQQQQSSSSSSSPVTVGEEEEVLGNNNVKLQNGGEIRKVSLVKQHQMQLKQQLQMATPNTQTPYQLRTAEKNREILATLLVDNNELSKDNEPGWVINKI